MIGAGTSSFPSRISKGQVNCRFSELQARAQAPACYPPIPDLQRLPRAQQQQQQRFQNHQYRHRRSAPFSTTRVKKARVDDSLRSMPAAPGNDLAKQSPHSQALSLHRQCQAEIGVRGSLPSSIPTMSRSCSRPRASSEKAAPQYMQYSK